MSGQVIRTVIGKGFGDEGKGLCVDYFCKKAPGSLVIKHNGGAQAGHTVETDGKRFVFHQLSAGSFRNSVTLWSDTYYPDIYKLREEYEDFFSVSGFGPKIYADAKTPITLTDDVLVNMLLETKRGSSRHGSCGMGINEAYLRTHAGFGIFISDLFSKSSDELVRKISEIRENYFSERLKEEGIDIKENINEYSELLQSKNVIENAVEEMLRNASEYVVISEDIKKLLDESSEICFETGQGLLLDAENLEFSPHLTMSRTGLCNPVSFLKRYNKTLTEAVYVTRTYVTRHGAGPLPYECSREELGLKEEDLTNIENPWQGKIRYASHGSFEEFVSPVKKDIDENVNLSDSRVNTKASLFITHINETDGKIFMKDENIKIDAFLNNPKITGLFKKFYFSDGKEAENTTERED